MEISLNPNEFGGFNFGNLVIALESVSAKVGV